MKNIPETENSLVLRTDFSDDAAWESVCAAIQEPYPEWGFQACVDCLSDPEYEGLTTEQLASLPRGIRSFAFIVDQVAFAHPEHPILVVDLFHEPGRTFRVIPSEMWCVENNLSLAKWTSKNWPGLLTKMESSGALRCQKSGTVLHSERRPKHGGVAASRMMTVWLRERG